MLTYGVLLHHCKLWFTKHVAGRRDRLRDAWLVGRRPGLHVRDMCNLCCRFCSPCLSCLWGPRCNLIKCCKCCPLRCGVILFALLFMILDILLALWAFYIAILITDASLEKPPDPGRQVFFIVFVEPFYAGAWIFYLILVGVFAIWFIIDFLLLIGGIAKVYKLVRFWVFISLERYLHLIVDIYAIMVVASFTSTVHPYTITILILGFHLASILLLLLLMYPRCVACSFAGRRQKQLPLCRKCKRALEDGCGTGVSEDCTNKQLPSMSDDKPLDGCGKVPEDRNNNKLYCTDEGKPSDDRCRGESENFATNQRSCTDDGKPYGGQAVDPVVICSASTADPRLQPPPMPPHPCQQPPPQGPQGIYAYYEQDPYMRGPRYGPGGQPYQPYPPYPLCREIPCGIRYGGGPSYSPYMGREYDPYPGLRYQAVEYPSPLFNERDERLRIFPSFSCANLYNIQNSKRQNGDGPSSMYGVRDERFGPFPCKAAPRRSSPGREDPYKQLICNSRRIECYNRREDSLPRQSQYYQDDSPPRRCDRYRENSPRQQNISEKETPRRSSIGREDSPPQRSSRYRKDSPPRTGSTNKATPRRTCLCRENSRRRYRENSRARQNTSYKETPQRTSDYREDSPPPRGDYREDSPPRRSANKEPSHRSSSYREDPPPRHCSRSRKNSPRQQTISDTETPRSSAYREDPPPRRGSCNRENSPSQHTISDKETPRSSAYREDSPPRHGSRRANSPRQQTISDQETPRSSAYREDSPPRRSCRYRKDSPSPRGTPSPRRSRCRKCSTRRNLYGEKGLNDENRSSRMDESANN